MSVNLESVSVGVMPRTDRVCILGLPIDLMTMSQAVDAVHYAARTRQKCFISTPNLNFLINARRDPAFKTSVLRSDLSLADGVSLLAVARMMGVRLPERVSGADLFVALCQSDKAPPLRVFFLGGPPGAAQKACDNMNRSAKGAIGVGFDEAGFGDVESLSSQSLIDKINACEPDFVVVSLGAAKGQAWIMRNHARLTAPVISHLGAVVNFTAGTVRRAPKWIQHCGMEWLWRACTEPGLFDRYWRDGKALLGILLTKHLSNAFQERLAKKGMHVAPKADVVPNSDASTKQLQISGHWDRNALHLLDMALQIGHQVKHIEIDANGVTWLDPYALGTLATHHGQLLKRGGTGVKISNLAPPVRMQLRRHEADYLVA
jgi:N-acetylglucosaminyldiphosphoundecaprenol N-acetyl-beta-D-mannosaminyltransferase